MAKKKTGISPILITCLLIGGLIILAYFVGMNPPPPQPPQPLPTGTISIQPQQSFNGIVKTGAQLNPPRLYCKDGLYLVAKSGEYLTGQTTTLQLRVQDANDVKLFSDKKYTGKTVTVTGKYPAQEAFCQAFMCDCEDYILVDTIQIQ